MEPQQFIRGKLFHKLVQSAWSGKIENSIIRPEHSINLSNIELIHSSTTRGRMDLFIEKMDDFVTIIEIKSTNWDKVKKHNRKNLAASHIRQILIYVDNYLAENNVTVCAALLYPKAPESNEVKEEIEKYLNESSLQVAWFK